jgi:hypothetical protein
MLRYLAYNTFQHCFANHLYEFVESYGCVNQFNLRDLEKLTYNPFDILKS